MQRKTILWVLIGASLGILAVFGWQRWTQWHALGDDANLIQRLPTKDAVVLRADFATLRRAHILDWLFNTKTPEDAEYRRFVQDSGFDYRRDLDSVLTAFAPDGTFILARGRFDWGKLRFYASSQGGKCENDLCRLTGSKPERRISYFLLRSDLLALAVSTDDSAALRLKLMGPQRDVETSSDPVWLSVPVRSLGGASLPSSAQYLASALGGAEQVNFSIGAAAGAAGSTGADSDFEIRLSAACRSPKDAAALQAQLAKASAIIRDAIAAHDSSVKKTKAGPAAPADESPLRDVNSGDALGRILGSGDYVVSGSHVTGHIRIPRKSAEALLGAG